MFPVFSLVLDQDVQPEMAMLYPELYKDLTKVRARAAAAILAECLLREKVPVVKQLPGGFYF